MPMFPYLKATSSIVVKKMLKFLIHATNMNTTSLGFIVVVSSNQIVRLYSRFTSLDKNSNGYLR